MPTTTSNITELVVNIQTTITLSKYVLVADEPIHCTRRNNTLYVSSKYTTEVGGTVIPTSIGRFYDQIYSNRSRDTISVTLANNKKLEVDGIDVTDAVKRILANAKKHGRLKDEREYALPTDTEFQLEFLTSKGSGNVYVYRECVSQDSLILTSHGSSEISFCDTGAIKIVLATTYGSGAIVGNNMFVDNLTLTMLGSGTIHGFRVISNLDASSFNSSNISVEIDNDCQATRTITSNGNISLLRAHIAHFFSFD